MVFMQFLLQDSLKTIFQNLYLKFTLYALRSPSYAHQILFYETQESSYLAPSTFAPYAQLLVIYDKLLAQLRFTLYAVRPAFMKSTPGRLCLMQGPIPKHLDLNPVQL
jgi:hypothetical protein